MADRNFNEYQRALKSANREILKVSIGIFVIIVAMFLYFDFTPVNSERFEDISMNAESIDDFTPVNSERIEDISMNAESIDDFTPVNSELIEDIDDFTPVNSKWMEDI